MRNSKGPLSESPRQSFFNQEVTAEGQARAEISEYLDTLADSPDYEETCECVLSLEDYRREGWAKEMLVAFPQEASDFIRKGRDKPRRSVGW